MLRGWPATFHAAQSVPLARKKKGVGRGPYGSHFYMLFGMTRLQGQERAGPAQKRILPFIHICSGSGKKRLSGFQQAACELSASISIKSGTCASGDRLCVTVFFFFFVNILISSSSMVLRFPVDVTEDELVPYCASKSISLIEHFPLPLLLKHSEIIPERKCLMINASKCQPCNSLACLPFPMIH